MPAKRKATASKDSDTVPGTCVFLQSEVTIHVVSEARDNNANFAWPRQESGFIHHFAPQTAMRDSAFLESDASLQVVSEAKDNMVALPGQLFYSMQFPPVCLWLAKKAESISSRAGMCGENELSLAALQDTETRLRHAQINQRHSNTRQR